MEIRGKYNRGHLIKAWLSGSKELDNITIHCEFNEDNPRSFWVDTNFLDFFELPNMEPLYSETEIASLRRLYRWLCYYKKTWE